MTFNPMTPEEQPILPPAGNPARRSRLLTVLCILTFIWSGLICFSSLMAFLFFDMFRAAAPEAAKIWKQPELAQLFMNARPAYFASEAGISVLAIAGAAMMWQLRKLGFHLYTIAQILLIIVPMYFFRLPGPVIQDILVSGVFVLLYGSNLKTMS
jgi:hypothetical protein